MGLSKSVRLANFLEEFEQMFNIIDEEERQENEEFSKYNSTPVMDFDLSLMDNIITEEMESINNG